MPLNITDTIPMLSRQIFGSLQMPLIDTKNLILILAIIILKMLMDVFHGVAEIKNLFCQIVSLLWTLASSPMVYCYGIIASLKDRHPLTSSKENQVGVLHQEESTHQIARPELLYAKHKQLLSEDDSHSDVHRPLPRFMRVDKSSRHNLGPIDPSRRQSEDNVIARRNNLIAANNESPDILMQRMDALEKSLAATKAQKAALARSFGPKDARVEK